MRCLPCLRLSVPRARPHGANVGLLLLMVLAIGAPSLTRLRPIFAAEPEEAALPRLLVPAYFYPAGEGLAHWDNLIAAAKQADITAIVNPASGPGEKSDLNYVEVVRRADKAGVRLLGYVSTAYGKRTQAEMTADIDRWLKLYPKIDGIFLDEQASSAEQVDLYGQLYDYARKQKKLKLVVTNPGTACAEEYVQRPAADTVCLFEGPKGFLDAKLPGWTEDYTADRCLALAYDVSADDWQAHWDAAVSKRCGWVYITDASGANPWDKLPSYWDKLVAAGRKRVK
ncbi:MAG: spherulation-specific family 4 protein [Pirellulales bacterium]